jgi:DNA-binding NtrC family response regulator
MNRVLIVDDDPDIVAMLTDLLEAEGYEINAAHSVRDAVKTFLVEPCDVVITDVQMPGADGFDLLNMLRDMASEVPVILISGHMCQENLVRSIDLGSFAYIEKPIDVPYFSSVVEKATRAVGRRRAVTA